VQGKREMTEEHGEVDGEVLEHGMVWDVGLKMGFCFGVAVVERVDLHGLSADIFDNLLLHRIFRPQHNLSANRLTACSLDTSKGLDNVIGAGVGKVDGVARSLAPHVVHIHSCSSGCDLDDDGVFSILLEGINRGLPLRSPSHSLLTPVNGAG